MLVDVVPLRQRGIPRGREAVLAAQPHRGYLSVVRLLKESRRQAFFTHWPEQRTASDAASVLLPLNGVVLTRIDGDSFVIAGYERVTEHFSQTREFHQAWWCRLVHTLVR